MKLTHQLIVFVSLVAFIPSAASAARFSKVKKLTVSYKSKNDKVKINWADTSGASQYKYIVKDSNNEVVSRGKVTTSKKKLSASLFTPNETYSVSVKVLKSGSTSASKLKTLSYTHERVAATGKGNIQTTNSSDRSGSFYIPNQIDDGQLPLLLLFHGTGGDGEGMVDAFSSLADEYGFAIVAPDSRKSPGGDFTWEVGTTQNEVTDDYTHALACMNEVTSFANLTLDTSRVLTAGYSGGASSAPYLATNEDAFTHFGILHGGMFLGGFGSEKPEAWLSTGTDDSLRPPSELQSYATTLTNTGFSSVNFKEYSGGHELSESEKRELIQWWLGQ
ncbi:MAG: hypothetical protein KDD55_01900 [Bdellovibrionales bacterium]|nr:hypothetical protein [Bdellovibrionales bacterium]